MKTIYAQIIDFWKRAFLYMMVQYEINFEESSFNRYCRPTSVNEKKTTNLIFEFQMTTDDDERKELLRAIDEMWIQVKVQTWSKQKN